jgi:lipopolysaccharide heptosyltransferase II
MEAWNDCKNILCIRPDNIGDLLMSSPAIAALKETFNARITVLTSSVGKSIVPFIPVIDEVIVFDVPWVKSSADTRPEDFFEIVDVIRSKHFDAAVVFSVFSQNPLPTVMLAYLAGVPKRLAYCRENPYHLLTDWIPEKEPYSFILHQVRRDLNLVKAVGARTDDEQLRLSMPDKSLSIKKRLQLFGVDISRPWIVFHPGVSEEKRQFPVEKWIATGKLLTALNYEIIITGTKREFQLASKIASAIGKSVFNLAGELSMDDFIALIAVSAIVVSVNTAAVHIASAVKTPIIVLYALTNPQHAPWQSKGVVFTFPVDAELQSKNEVLRFVNNSFFQREHALITPQQIAEAAKEILNGKALHPIPELITTDVTG